MFFNEENVEYHNQGSHTRNSHTLDKIRITPYGDHFPHIHQHTVSMLAENIVKFGYNLL